MADVLAEDVPDLFQPGAPTPTIVDAIAYVPEVSKVTQKVQTATINEAIKGARMKVGARVKGKAHRLLGPIRSNVLYNERATSVDIYGNVIRAAAKDF
jgi:hypothetical protein